MRPFTDEERAVLLKAQAILHKAGYESAETAVYEARRASSRMSDALVLKTLMDERTASPSGGDR